jgi:hypothetical protein
MRILALEHDSVTPPRPDLSDILRAEAAAVWDLQQRGIIRDIWFNSRRHAVVILECPSLLEARNHLAALPLVRAGLSDFDLQELSFYDGYKRLFGSGAPATLRHEEPPEY